MFQKFKKIYEIWFVFKRFRRRFSFGVKWACKAIEEKFGVSATAVAGAGASGAAPAAEEQSAYTVMLTSAGEQKIAVMKIVKEVLGLGLKDAKDLVDAAPSTLKAGMKKEEANDLKKKIEAAGGKVELK